MSISDGSQLALAIIGGSGPVGRRWHRLHRLQAKAAKIFEILKYLETLEIRDARRTLYKQLKVNPSPPNWWKHDDTAFNDKLEKAASTVCASLAQSAS
jgi:hypothetical protein